MIRWSFKSWMVFAAFVVLAVILGQSYWSSGVTAAPEGVAKPLLGGAGAASGAVEAVSRAPQEMQEMDAQVQATLAALGPIPEDIVAAMAPKPKDPAKLAAAKALAESITGAERPAAPTALAPPILQNSDGKHNYEGNTYFNNPIGVVPPDPHGAVGPSHFVQVNNTMITVRTKSYDPSTGLPTPCINTSLNAFFGVPLASFSDLLFDPRAEWDPYWNRYIVHATRFPHSTDTAVLAHFAVSKTSSPCGGWWVYTLSVVGGIFNPGDLWDYGQMGYNQDAVLLTGNLFGPTAFDGTFLFTFSKARAYNGRGFPAAIFTGFDFTLAPPVLISSNLSNNNLSENDDTYFLAADTYGGEGGDCISYPQSYLSLYRGNRLENVPGAQPTVVFMGCVSVPAWGFPPSAPQPGILDKLDTSDGRIQNRITQSASVSSPRLFATHTTSDFGFALPRYYEVNATAIALARGAWFYASSSSYDFNPSIAANGNGEVFISYSSTDPPAGSAGKAQVRITGCQNGIDCPAGPGFSFSAISPGSSVFTSAASFDNGNLTVQVFRWGDYSQTHLDPQGYSGCTTNRRAWGTNERIDGSGGIWGTQIYRFGFC